MTPPPPKVKVWFLICSSITPLGRDPYRKAGRGGLGRVGPP